MHDSPYHEARRSPFSEIVDGSICEYLGNQSYGSTRDKSVCSGLELSRKAAMKISGETETSLGNRTTTSLHHGAGNYGTDQRIFAETVLLRDKPLACEDNKAVIRVEGSIDSDDESLGPRSPH